MRRTFFEFPVAIAVGCIVCALPAMGQLSVPQIIVVTGDAAPDGNGVFSTFQSLALNDQGQVAFRAILSGTAGGASDDAGIFRGDGSTLVSIAREGQADPSGNGSFSNFPSRPVINDAGQVALSIGLIGTTGGPTDDRGIFLGDGTTLVMLAREGQPGPGGGTFSLLAGHALNNAGQVSFRAGLTGTSGGFADNEGLFRSDGTTLTEIVRKGQAAPVEGVFEDFNADETLNDAGQVAFHGIVIVDGFNVWNMYVGDGGGALTTVAREGEPAPGGTFLIIGSNPVLNESGQVAFDATLDNTSGGSSDDTGIFRGAGGAIDTIVREGDGVPDGVGSFSDFLNEFAINGAGKVVFSAALAGAVPPADRGIYRGDDSTLPLPVVRGGDAAPDGDGIFLSLNTPALNDAGQVAFSAIVGEDIRGGETDVAVFLFDEGMGLLTVARSGEAFLGSTITALSFHPGDPPSEEGSGLNDQGQVAYSFILADGRQGIAVRTIPEPSSQTLLAFGVLSLSGLLRNWPRS